MPFCSSIRSITGWGVCSISLELASAIPSTLRANSITAHCMPRQMPRNGMPFSRAKRTASILPSMPRFPNPGATRIPAIRPNCAATFDASIFSEFT